MIVTRETIVQPAYPFPSSLFLRILSVLLCVVGDIDRGRIWLVVVMIS